VYQAELKEQLLIAWKSKAGYAPPTGSKYSTSCVTSSLFSMWQRFFSLLYLCVAGSCLLQLQRSYGALTLGEAEEDAN
jgi:hypothetical protein